MEPTARYWCNRWEAHVQPTVERNITIIKVLVFFFLLFATQTIALPWLTLASTVAVMIGETFLELISAKGLRMVC